MKSEKRGAFEMSITTIVILVIAMTLLVLGLVFVRQIFGTATKSVDTIDDQTQNELMNLFGESGSDIIVKLGSQQTAKVKQGTENFGFMFAVSPEDPSIVNSCKYSLEKGTGDCKNPDPAKWFVGGKLPSGASFNKISEGVASALVKLSVPSNQAPCQQLFNIKVTCGSWTAQDFFNIDVIKKGFI